MMIQNFLLLGYFQKNFREIFPIYLAAILFMELRFNHQGIGFTNMPLIQGLHDQSASLAALGKR